MELLSPAGHWDAMVAAVQNGADAVYMGFGDYNARRGARNFSEEEYLAAVSYCHLRGVKVYLTLNTLLGDRELDKAVELLGKASRMGVDAVIVQDWGVLKLCRALYPDLPVHSSTQMTIHTRSGAREAARMGMTCAVLSRELSEEEICYICADSPIAIETFGHGALCMCYSGQCAMSALIGQRSGNRGKCAQPCRLPYKMDGGKVGYPLSLKDSCLADYACTLRDMGVECLKLEGRMKRPEYVAVITDIYARLLKENRSATKEEKARLAEAFSRSGFTDGYYTGKKGSAMFGVRPENAPDPTALFAAARAAYEKEQLRTVPVTLHCAIHTGEAAVLTAADSDGHTVTVTGAVPEAARSRELTEEDVAARLSKTGGTAFTCAKVTCNIHSGLSLSASAINALRRDALDALAAARTAPAQRREGTLAPLSPIANCKEAPKLSVSLMRADQFTPGLMAYSPAVVSIPVHLIDSVDISPYLGRETLFTVELPRIWRDKDEPWLSGMLEKAKASGYGGVNIHNLGQLPMAKASGLAIRGDYSLNIFNSQAVEFWREEGLSSLTLSFELRHEQIRDIRKAVDCEAIVYGRLPLMVMENCIISNAYGCKAKHLHGQCSKPHVITDRKGESFPVCGVFGCRNEIENAKTLFLADKPEYLRLGLRYARLRFTTESPEQCEAVMARYCGHGEYVPDDLTRGLFYRGVE